RRVSRLPAGAARDALRLGGAAQALGRKESGVNPIYLADLLLADLFIEPTSGRPLDPALRETFPNGTA
ncbi:nucleoside-diphosphate sugar epimerase, partial [Micromonospora inaquosa]